MSAKPSEVPKESPPGAEKKKKGSGGQQAQSVPTVEKKGKGKKGAESKGQEDDIDAILRELDKADGKAPIGNLFFNFD